MSRDLGTRRDSSFDEAEVIPGRLLFKSMLIGISMELAEHGKFITPKCGDQWSMNIYVCLQCICMCSLSSANHSRIYLLVQTFFFQKLHSIVLETCVHVFYWCSESGYNAPDMQFLNEKYE